MSVVRWTHRIGHIGLCVPVRRWHSHRSRRRLITICRRAPPAAAARGGTSRGDRRPTTARAAAAKRPRTAAAAKRAAAARRLLLELLRLRQQLAAWATASAIAAWAMPGRSRLPDALLRRSTTYGGWISAGYLQPQRAAVGRPGRPALVRTTIPDHLNLDQAWFYVEKLAEADGCCCDWGYRFDMFYGVDAQKTQAFGNDGGIVGRDAWTTARTAGPSRRSTAKSAWSDWSVKVGHFFTPIGYEVIPATGNFFYSHSLHDVQQRAVYPHRRVGHLQRPATMLTLYAGWTLGWDTGFDQLDGGNNFLGGFGRSHRR